MKQETYTAIIQAMERELVTSRTLTKRFWSAAKVCPDVLLLSKANSTAFEYALASVSDALRLASILYKINDLTAPKVVEEAWTGSKNDLVAISLKTGWPVITDLIMNNDAIISKSMRSETMAFPFVNKENDLLYDHAAMAIIQYKKLDDNTVANYLPHAMNASNLGKRLRDESFQALEYVKTFVNNISSITDNSRSIQAKALLLQSMPAISNANDSMIVSIATLYEGNYNDWKYVISNLKNEDSIPAIAHWSEERKNRFLIDASEIISEIRKNGGKHAGHDVFGDKVDGLLNHHISNLSTIFQDDEEQPAVTSKRHRRL